MFTWLTLSTRENLHKSFLKRALINIMFGISCVFLCIPVVKTGVGFRDLLPTESSLLTKMHISLYVKGGLGRKSVTLQLRDLDVYNYKNRAEVGFFLS